MDINIKKNINRLKEKYQNNTPEKKVENIISQEFNIYEEIKCKINNGIISFIIISPILKTKIKLKKELIIKECKKNDIYIRDII